MTQLTGWSLWPCTLTVNMDVKRGEQIIKL